MPTYIAFLRAVNVGGRYYKMAALRDHLTESGLTEVETYIQTGNVRFRTGMRSAVKVERHVEEVLSRHCGFDVPSMIFSPAELREVYDDAQRLDVPEPAEPGPLRRYVSFFKQGSQPDADVARQLADWDAPGEAAAVLGRAVHIAITGSMMDAKVFGAYKSALAPGTVRDLKVVTALVQRWAGGVSGPTVGAPDSATQPGPVDLAVEPHAGQTAEDGTGQRDQHRGHRRDDASGGE